MKTHRRLTTKQLFLKRLVTGIVYALFSKYNLNSIFSTKVINLYFIIEFCPKK